MREWSVTLLVGSCIPAVGFIAARCWIITSEVVKLSQWKADGDYEWLKCIVNRLKRDRIM